MKYNNSTIPVCSECSASAIKVEDSKQQNEGLLIRSCRRCGIHFCVHYSSSTDVRYCGNCLSDFRVSISLIEKTEEKIDDESGQILARKRQVAKSIHLTGTDWLFESHKISEMNDEELLASIEYHDAIKGLLLHERETRRIEKFKKMASIRLPHNVIDAPTAKGIGTSPNTTLKSRTTRTKKKDDPNTVAHALNALLGIKIDPAAIAAALKNKK